MVLLHRWGVPGKSACAPRCGRRRRHAKHPLQTPPGPLTSLGEAAESEFEVDRSGAKVIRSMAPTSSSKKNHEMSSAEGRKLTPLGMKEEQFCRMRGTTK
jgi:hypothetical protein